MRLMIALFLVLWAGHPAAAENADGRLTVIGEGAVASVPDTATITIGVQFQAQTVAAAMDAVSQATGAVLDRLANMGVAPRDMQTRDLTLNPIWSNRDLSVTAPPTILGFEASNSVMVRVRDLDALGRVLDTVVQSGGNNFRGLSFGLQNPGPIRDAARTAAVAEAIRKARLYANAAGLRLGPVLQLSESGSAPVTYGLERMVTAVADVPVAQGEISTTASVTMVFAITDSALQ